MYEKTKENKSCAQTILRNTACVSMSFPPCIRPRQKLPAPWKYEYHPRGDEAFQEHVRQIVETGVTAPSGQGEVYYAGPSDDVQGIINSLAPGDTLYLQGGVYSRKIRIYGGVNRHCGCLYHDRCRPRGGSHFRRFGTQRTRPGSGRPVHVLALRLFLCAAKRL